MCTNCLGVISPQMIQYNIYLHGIGYLKWVEMTGHIQNESRVPHRLLCTKALSFCGALELVPSDHAQISLGCNSSSVSVMLLHSTPEFNCPFMFWASLL